MFLLLLIVNKNGSLIYDRRFTNKIELNSNDYIQIAAIFYSMHAISSKLTPSSLSKSSDLKLYNQGIEVIEANSVKLVCYQTLTKLKFIFVIDYQSNDSDCIYMFKKIYDIYSDLVSKNPFYELDMPIRIEAFDNEITKLFT